MNNWLLKRWWSRRVGRWIAVFGILIAHSVLLLGATGTAVSTVLSGVPRFDAFVTLPDGDVLAAEGFQGSRVLRISPEGHVTEVVSGLHGPVFILPLEDDTFAVSNFGDGSIVEVKLDGSREKIARGLDAPVGMVQDRESGDLLVVNFGANYQGKTISRISKKGKVSSFVSDPQLNAPIDLCFGPAGKLYVATFNDGYIFTVSPGKVELFARLPSGRINHMVCNETALYTTSALSNKIYRVESDGTVVEIAGTGLRASEDGSLSGASFLKPNGIVVDGEALLVSQPTGSIRRVILPGS